MRDLGHNKIMIKGLLYIPHGAGMNRYIFYFFYLLLFELFIGGSGQDVHITGFLTLRMVNYTIAINLGLLYFIQGAKIPRDILLFVVFFTILITIAFLLAVTNGSKSDYVLEDIKPLSYFYIIIFFYFLLPSKFFVERMYYILLLSVKILIVLYLIYILLTDVLGMFDFSWAYSTFISDNFMFRGVGSAFFYKGFIFLPIAAIGFLKDKKYVWFVLSAIAIYCTYTRGLYLLLGLGSILFFLRYKNVNFISVLCLFFIGYAIYEGAKSFELFDQGEEFSEKRSGGDERRLITINQVQSEITFTSFIIGHGFGQSVAERPVHMEMSYLEIFHKQGVLGLLFWIALLVFILIYNKKVRINNKNISDFFVIASILIYIQSLFNPYLNNPIGMGMVLLSFVSCYRLSHENTLCNRTI